MPKTEHKARISNRKTVEITNALTLQSEAVLQVTSGMDRISSIGKDTLKTSEESAAASEELSAQAMNLKSLVGKFQMQDKMRN